MKRTNWFDRIFEPIADHTILPDLIERLEGTGLRIERKIEIHGKSYMQGTANNKWSIKEEIGHLGDLEPLWLERTLQIKKNEADLVPADLDNTKTEEATHDAKKIKDLIVIFSKQREVLINALRGFEEEQMHFTCKHPRLGTAMRIVDLANFVAEHDDHHLATMHDLLSN